MTRMVRVGRSLRLVPVVTALLTACSGGDGAGPAAPAPVATVTVAPSTAEIEVGSTAQLNAQTLDAAGNVLSGRGIVWATSNPAFATVDQSGLVRAVAPGSVAITATSEGRLGSAAIQVRNPPVARVDVTPNPAGVQAGQTVQLSAVARTAAGVVLEGKTFAWTSSNTAVVGVDQAGLVNGVVVGPATVTATVDGVAGTATVNVTLGPPIVIAQITPAVLVEGQTATVTGSGFGTGPAATQVSIDGTPALVTSVTTTAIQLVVPTYDCRPKRTVPIQVSVTGETSAPANATVAPPGFTALAVGQQLVLQGTTGRCIQLDALSGSERYVVGVQSISEVVATLTGVMVTSVIPGTATASPPFPVPDSGPRIGEPFALTPERELWSRHVEATVAAYERERAILQPLLDRRFALAAGALAAAPTVPGTVQEGDQLTIRYPNFDGNSCTEFTNITVRVRKLSARGVFLEDVSNPAQLPQATFDQAALDFAVIYDVDVDHFGTPGDVDGNQRLVIVVTKEVNQAQRSSPLGFVAHANLFPVTQCIASNEGEFFFMRAADPTGQFKAGVYTAATLANQFPTLLGHEFAHVIQGSRRVAAGGQFMVSWLAEGLATAAEEAVGFQMLGLQSGRNFGPETVYVSRGADPRTFFGYMGDLLAYFGTDFTGGRRVGAPEECSWVGSTTTGGTPGPCAFATRLLYGVPWSLIKTAIDRHHGGPAGQKQVLRAFSDRVGPPGFADLEAVLGRPITTLITEWAPMLYIDDRYPGAGFQYANWNLRAIAGAFNPSADMLPRVRGFASFSDVFNVRAGSAAYYEISGAARPPTAIRARSVAGGTLPSFIVVWIVRVQ